MHMQGPGRDPPSPKTDTRPRTRPCRWSIASGGGGWLSLCLLGACTQQGQGPQTAVEQVTPNARRSEDAAASNPARHRASSQEARPRPGPADIKPQRERPLDPRLEIELEYKRKLRKKLLLIYADRQPRGPVDPKFHALAAFDAGFELDGATIRISPIGCSVEVVHRGYTYVAVLDEFASCRLAERMNSGQAHVQAVKGRTGRGVVVIEVRDNGDDPRCLTLMRSLRVTPTGPRIAPATSRTAMCSFRGIDGKHYEIMSSEDVGMVRL